ncbi:iron transporter [Larsenimonas rhizosphaerae]|uniref:Iron transporter n=1 Tax=Larsenimonas rhizosphaerae TaxID=2944682 RepID=A0AA42CXU3_9GAMM|nr:iron transporter [Larsenimonas rhizosphaerae]MCM2129630.1 iron transporter [Larsenimonas rhizosphaerae]MCX2524288.1 iron transporter [Larsenimonas rhizosphaerae]
MSASRMLWALPALALFSTSAMALEYPIGKPKHEAGMEIAAVYLQPVTMEPAGKLAANKADVHLEADIHSLEDNPNGFAPGDWIPYLSVHYALSKKGSDNTIEGDFMPMVASDGPHYGANVKLDGPGKYHLTYTITHPDMQRHVDKETGVGAWYDPITVEYDFTYAGVGKKGGY